MNRGKIPEHASDNPESCYLKHSSDECTMNLLYAGKWEGEYNNKTSPKNWLCRRSIWKAQFESNKANTPYQRVKIISLRKENENFKAKYSGLKSTRFIMLKEIKFMLWIFTNAGLKQHKLYYSCISTDTVLLLMIN